MSLEITTTGYDGLAKFDARPTNFPAMAAHELRSPLRSLRIYLDILNSNSGTSNMDQESLDLVAKSLQAVDKMQKILDGILDCSLMEHRTSPKTVVDMHQLVNEVSSGLKDELEQAQVRISVKELPVVRYNPEQLACVFTNLLRNAIQYRGAVEPQIEIRAEHSGDQYKIFVKDNGIGISPEHQKLVFEPFSQLDKARQVSQAGLGLYICKSIIEQNGGHIDVQSAIGRGTEFVFSIKVASNERI